MQVVGRLTQKQMDALSLVVLIRRPRPIADVVNLPSIYNHLRSQISPWAPILDTDELDLHHLAYTGCLSIADGSCTFASALWQAFSGLWSHGISPEEIPEELRELVTNGTAFVRCLRDPTKLQVNAINKSVADSLASTHGFPLAWVALLERNRMSEAEIDEDVALQVPELEDVISKWNETKLSHCELTSVGIAVGHANARRRLGREKVPPLPIYGV